MLRKEQLVHCHNSLFTVKFKFSQNHKMLGVGRDLWGSSSPTPLPKHVHLKQAAQNLIQVKQEKDTSQPPWAACSSALSPSKWRNSSLCSDGTPYASVCTHCPLSSRWVPLKRFWPHPLDTHP